ncbi:MAG: hypothetical protein AAF673_00985 [Pseudomonadota bacterium]
MAKTAETDLVAEAPDTGKSDALMFSLPELVLPVEGMDLEGFLATLLSESGSITPRTIKAEGFVNEEVFSPVLKEIIAHQKPLIEARMKELEERRTILVDQLREAETEKARFEDAKIGDDISQAKTKPEIIEKVTLIRELGQEIDIIVKDFRALLGMIQAFEHEVATLPEEGKEGDKSEVEDPSVSEGGIDYKAPIMLKTYQENAGLLGSDDNLEVIRFALVAENLRGMEGQSLISDMLHPLEVVLLNEALHQLKMFPEKTGGVVCDIFVRVDNKISTADDGSDRHIPETHCIALWKENDTLYVIDPSNSNFSSPLIEEIKIIWGSDEVIKSIDGVLYGNGKKPVGRIDGTALDCIDIAVKIILEMSYQTEKDAKKKVDYRLAKTFMQLTTENKYAKHFSKNSDRQLRELTSTSADIRHLSLKVAKAIAGVR